ncbi:MAG TPA: hypothetical protein VK142_02025 [Bacillota bacterium]|nr:hypothetical protein [Bacillota bacterium]
MSWYVSNEAGIEVGQSATRNDESNVCGTKKRLTQTIQIAP